jgi:hypothetical protein
MFFYQKLQFSYPYASIKDVQATEEAFSAQKRTSITSKLKISSFFIFFWGQFCPPGSGSVGGSGSISGNTASTKLF